VGKKSDDSDSFCYRWLDHIYPEKTSTPVDNIDDLVDNTLAKDKVIFGNNKAKDSKGNKSFDNILSKKLNAKFLWNRGGQRRVSRKVDNPSKKKVLSFLLSILLIFVTIVSAPFVSVPDGSSSGVLSVSLDPDHVYNNDTMFVNVSIRGSYNISSVTCDMGGIETIDLSLFNALSTEQLWQAKWVVHDAEVGEHVAIVTATDDENISYYSEVSYGVLPQEIIEDSNSSEILTNETVGNIHNDTSIGNESLNETTPLVNITDGNRTSNNTTSVTDDVNTTSASSDEIDANAKPYVYHIAPANSFGVRSVKVTNWSYFWDLFNQHSYWDLEYRNGSEWISCQDALTIDRSRSADNSFEKITLNFTSPVAADYRLTFAIDRHVKTYVNRSGQYEYRLTYAVGDDETYDVFFNWSDMAGIPGVTFRHGVTDRQGKDVFWFRCRRNNVPAGYNVVLDPIFGDQTTSISLDTIEDVIRGSKFTCTESGLATSISAYLEESSGAGNDLKYAIYKASDASLVGYTQVDTDPDDGWNTMDIASGGNLFAGTDYYLVAWAESTSESMEIYYDAGSNAAAYDDEVFNGFPSQWAQTSDGTKDYSIYCTYTYAAPNITGELPADQSTGISRQPICNVTVEDAQSDLMTVEFWSNATGTWIKEQTITSVSSLDSVVWSSFTNASEYNTIYWWSVNVTDGTFWTNQTYRFTTRTDSFVSTSDLGWEFLDNNTVIHAWNKGDSYYFNTSSGVQLTNHYDEYWSHNVLMLGYYSGDEWNLIYRTDELSGFTRDFEGETDSFMNLTLWKDLSYGGYDFRLAIRYHLGVDDRDLTIIPYIKNLGLAIPFQIGFGWEMKDINIANTYENDFIRLEQNASNATVYSLHNSSLDESYTNLTFAYTDDNQSWTWMPRTEFHLDNHKPNGDTDQTLYLKWDSSLTYKLQVKHRDGQYNAPVTLFVRVGTLAAGQEKSTAMQWYDAYVRVGDECPFNAGETQYIATCPINETDFLIAYMDGSTTDDGVVIVGRVSDGTTVDYGDPFVFCTDVGIGLGLDICIVNDATNRFMIAYADDADDDANVYTGTFSELVINAGESLEFKANDDLEHPAICKIRDDYAVVCYNNEGNSDTGEACVVYWDDSLNPGTSVEIDVNDGGADLDPFYTDCAQLDTDKFVVSFVDSESGTTQKNYVGTVLGTTITMGASVSPFDGLMRTTVSSFETDKYVYLGAGATTSEVTSYTVSTRDITEDASANCEGSHVTDLGLSGALLDSNSFVVAYADENNADKGTFIFVNISWTGDTVTWDGTSTIFNDAATHGGVADLGIHVSRLTDTSWVVAYQDDADGDAGKCVVGYTNLPPTQSSPGPSDGATEQVSNPTLNITVDDPADKTLTATWRSNSSDAWVDFATNSSIDTSSGAVNIIQTPVNFTVYSKKYWWSVNLTDGSLWGNETYSFTTEANVVPSIASETPTNESTQISRWPACSATVSDNNGDTMTVYFYENTTESWVLQQTNSDVANNSNVVWSNYSNASSFSTIYWWSVNVTDGESWTNETYHFTTFLKAILNITWAVDSQLDATYTEGNPLAKNTNETFTMNATIRCDGDAGATCGVVTVGARYDFSGGTMVYVNTTAGDTPFFVEGEGGGGGGDILSGTWYNMSPATKSGGNPLYGRYHAAMVYDPDVDRMIMFGGQNPDGTNLNDTWEYDHDSNTWTNRSPTYVGTLTPRYGADMVYDSDADKIILFGGNGGSPQVRQSDTWIYNYNNNTWWERSPIIVEGTLYARYKHRMVYDSTEKKTIMFGGQGRYNDTWEYDYDTNTWSNRTPIYDSGILWPRDTHGMTYDPIADKVILFGGYADYGPSNDESNDTWAYDYSDNTWYNRSPTYSGGTMEIRDDLRLVYDSNSDRTLLFGGGDFENIALNDTWVYNYTDNKWCNANAGAQPTKLYALAYDSNSKRTILFSGSGEIAKINYTWIYNYTGGAENPINIGTMNQGDSKQVNFTINVSGDSGTWEFDLNATSSLIPNVADNNTDSGYVLIGEAGVTAPTVITNESTGVEETNATLWGYLEDNGSADTTCWFLWDTDNDYANNVTQGVKAHQAEFSKELTTLTSGDLYYYNTKANNSAGWDDSGGELTFFTKPPKTTNLAEFSSTNTTLSYTWAEATVGDGATAWTRIQYKTGSNPTSITDGTNTYNFTDQTDDTTGLEPGTRYYFSAFSWGIESSVGNWNDTHNTMDAWTNPGDPTGLDTNNGTTWVNVTFTHGTNGEKTHVRRNASGVADYPATIGDGDGVYVDNTTNAYANDTGLVSEVKYYYSLWTWDTDGNKWCDNKNTTNGTTTSAGVDISFSLNRSTWHMGSIDLGDNTTTSNINLTNTGDGNIGVQIKGDNATNSTSGFRWNLTSNQTHNNFTLQFNRTGGGGTWTQINTSYDTFVLNLPYSGTKWQTFDLRIFMANTTDKLYNMSFDITLKSVAS